MKTASFLLAALLLMQPLAQAAPFIFSVEGEEVTDLATGLIWRRCAEGMAWNGATCAGSALAFTHENALIRARTQAAASGKAWRLPNVKELSSLVDRGRLNPAIDLTAFPAEPGNTYWSSTPNAGSSVSAWGVRFIDGFVYFSIGDDPFTFHDRSSGHAVRLVRSSQ